MKPQIFQFKGMNNVVDPASIDSLNAQGDQHGHCPKILNMDCGDIGVTTRLGRTLALSGAAHSGWSDGTNAYVVKSGYLCRFTGSGISNLLPVNPTLAMSYCKVNDLIICTNGQQYIVIEGGVAALSDISAGRYVVFLNGRVYVARGADLLCTDPYNVDNADARFRNIPVSSDEITGLAEVDDGIYIGTTKETFFMGDNATSFQQIAGYGVIHNTMKTAENGQVKLSKLTGKVAVWNSERGFCIGGRAGQFANISETKVAIPVVPIGSSFVREQGGDVYFVSVTGDGTGFNKYESEVDNRITSSFYLDLTATGILQ